MGDIWCSHSFEIYHSKVWPTGMELADEEAVITRSNELIYMAEEQVFCGTSLSAGTSNSISFLHEKGWP